MGGGLGLLAAREMAQGWGAPVYTTSRSGRLADTRPEVTQMLDTMQQMSLHVACRCDVADGAAITDLLAAVQRFPATDLAAAQEQRKRETDPNFYIDEWIT